MPFTQPWFEVNFGSAYAGIGTTGYRLYQATGADSVARTTTGVVDLGNGNYGVASVNVPDNAVGIEWDTGGGSPVYATEDIEPYRDRDALVAAVAALNDLSIADVQTALTNQGYTAARAPNLDNLDATISSVNAAIAALNDISIADVQTALTNQGYTAGRAVLLDNLDSSISNVLLAIVALNDLSQADVQSAMTAQGYTTVRAALIDNLDAAISSVIAAIAAAQIDITLIRAFEEGRWKRQGTRMTFYQADNTTPIAKFDLKKFDGTPAGEADDEVAERVRTNLGTTTTTTTS